VNPIVEKVAEALYEADETNVWPWRYSRTFWVKRRYTRMAEAAIEALGLTDAYR
jgi:hypothetical protein